jgi:hypothetical protein
VIFGQTKTVPRTQIYGILLREIFSLLILKRKEKKRKEKKRKEKLTTEEGL